MIASTIGPVFRTKALYVEAGDNGIEVPADVIGEHLAAAMIAHAERLVGTVGESEALMRGHLHEMEGLLPSDEEIKARTVEFLRSYRKTFGRSQREE